MPSSSWTALRQHIPWWSTGGGNDSHLRCRYVHLFCHWYAQDRCLLSSFDHWIGFHHGSPYWGEFLTYYLKLNFLKKKVVAFVPTGRGTGNLRKTHILPCLHLDSTKFHLFLRGREEENEKSRNVEKRRDKWKKRDLFLYKAVKMKIMENLETIGVFTWLSILGMPTKLEENLWVLSQAKEA